MKAAELYPSIRSALATAFESAGYRAAKSRYPAWWKEKDGYDKVIFFFIDPKYPFDDFTGGSFGGGLCVREHPLSQVERSDYDSLQCIVEPTFTDSLAHVQSRVLSKLLAKVPTNEDERLIADTSRMLWEMDLRQPFRPRCEQYLKYTDRSDLEAWFHVLAAGLPTMDSYLDALIPNAG